ncbi:GxxExxY protein [candidate division KSB1 bacterium]|nr:MAG: GxxExxY protein [candidate division KSB1 bacterium]MBC6948216.1 GxxExxY protein [candidate division KSB1 bacterium]MCE7942424.1 GxxExxY protein [Chlorobi bacterium CHB1]MDL1874467.1 GxxExxY protein [Cytophagia bacterium CHB2]
MALLHKELTFELRKCMIDVHNELGVGFDEETYHQGLIRRFMKAGMPFVSKQQRGLTHRGVAVRAFELDFLADDTVIAELKCLRCGFLRANYIQILSHLKLWQKHLGLLVNWGFPRLQIKRIPFSEKPKEITEEYGYIKGTLTEPERQTLAKLRDAILFVLETHGLGYGKSVYQDLVKAELQYRQIKMEKGKKVDVMYDGELIRSFPMRFWLIENRILCDVTALQDSILPEHAVRMQTFLKHLNLSTGLIVNFGKRKLELRGVHY